jgi:4-hydroxybenzoate polyprenyltransferase
MVGRFFDRLLHIPPTPYLFVVPFLVGAGRAILENVLFRNHCTDLETVLYYSTSYLLLQMFLLIVFRVASGRDYRELLGPATVGLVFGLLPPFLDAALGVPPGQQERYFRGFEWDFAAPYQALGETITLWLGVAAALLFCAWLTRNVWRTLLGTALCYAALQILTGPSWAVSYHLGKLCHLSPPAVLNMLIFLVALGTYSVFHRATMGPSLARVNHALPWGLAALLGARMAGQPWSLGAVKCLAMALAFQLVVIANDWLDRDADGAAGGTARPATHDDAVFSMLLQVLLLAWVATALPHAFAPALVFFGVWLAYQLPALRFKRLFCLGYKVEGAAGAAAFLFGVGAVRGPSGDWSWAAWIALLAFGGFAFACMFKDYKDIDQDRQAKIGTVYTRYLARGFTLRGIHRFVVIGLAIGLLVPAVWLALRGEPLWRSIVLAVLAVAPAVPLFRCANKRVAVERAFWCLDAYLLFLVFAVPVLG